MKNKRYQLKPALIMCAVMAALIIVIFVMAGNINRNVAKNMKGRLLYDEVSADGKSAVLLYDFTSGESAEISAEAGFDDAFGGVFAGENKAAFIARDGKQSGIYIYDFAKKQTDAVIVSEDADYLDFDYCAEKNCFACLCRNGGSWRIEEILADGGKASGSDKDNGSGEALFSSENEIYALKYSETGDAVYFVHANGNGGGILKSVKGSKLTTLYVSEKTALVGLEAADNTLFVCEKGEKGRKIAQYNEKRGSLAILKFNSDNYECAAVSAVSSTQFIVSADINGSFEIYVCNGSNIVRAEKINSDNDMIVSDYIP